MESDALEAGAAAGEYVIERLIGSGATGEVYAGRHPVIGKRVAIKVLHRELAASPEAAERFLREARAGNQIAHPNVIDAFAFGRLADERLYLVMDLVTGRSLRKALEAGPLDLALALDVLDQVASALDAAHARGIVHRDLKPDNVMLDDATPPNVRVLDFGIAKLATADAAASALTGRGAWVGTPAYMAPEQWTADGAGPGSDRYALGVMAFELLSGKLPFAGPSVPALMEQHFRAPVPALSSHRATLPPALDRVIARAMAKDPAARFATARELVLALREAAGPRSPRRPVRRLWIPAAAGAGVLGISVIGVVLARGGPSDHEGPAATAPTVRIDLVTLPDKATATRGGKLVGTTPLTLEVRPGEAVALELAKPGYRTLRTQLASTDVDQVVRRELVVEDGYQGTWRLPSGELRAFLRANEQVDVYKVATLGGPREFFRHYELVAPPGSADVAFAATEEMVDPRAPDDPQCHVPLHVEYRYRAAPDVLELRRERVALDVKDGHCVVVERDPGEPATLERVDRGPSDPRWTQPPVGPIVPEKPVMTKSRKTLDLKAAELRAKQAVIRGAKQIEKK